MGRNQDTVADLYREKRRVPIAFNRVASAYDLATRMSQGYQADLNRSASLLELRGDESVLDLCCGTGKSTAACLRDLREGRITGVDNSEGMLEVARTKFAQEMEAGRVDLVHADAMELDLPEGSYDAVFTAYGLRNMPDYDRFLLGIQKVLRPGGKLCIHDFSLVNRSWAKAYWAVLGYGFIVPFCTLLSGSSVIYRYLVKSVLRFETPAEIAERLEKHGFTNVRIHRHPGWRKPLLHTFTAVLPRVNNPL